MTVVLPALLPASIPSPDQGVWHLGPVPIRAYALSIVAGIIVAIWLGTRRWAARGGDPVAVSDVAIWAVPFGIVGARVYHVITDNQNYFGEGRDPWRMFEIWAGGIGIWGAIAGGALGVWIACRRKRIPFAAMADALVPGILIAQGIGRWGNWFNQELYGRPTDLPWGLEIDPANRPPEYRDQADVLFHPTFLYESLWAFAVAFLLMWADRRFKLGHGQVLALYVAGYTLGRSYFEYLRIDPANEILGLRVNQWVSALLFLAAVAFFVVSRRRHPDRENPDELKGTYATVEVGSTGEPTGGDSVADASDGDASPDAGAKPVDEAESVQTEPGLTEPKDASEHKDASQGDEPTAQDNESSSPAAEQESDPRP